ncbi:MAG: ATP-binding protein [Bacteroidales bacterium]
MPTDEVRFRQIFLNLMSNAIKFTERGTIEFGYYLEKKEGQDQVVIYVKDSGRGIAPDMQEVIFERFRQAKTHDNVAGTGLGLNISRGLVEKMGGSIWIESEEGVGSQFFVRFPCSVKEEERIVASHVPAPPAGKGILEGKLIYIAEDNRESYILLRDILTAEGAKVAQARDGEALLMLLDVRLPDLILLDLRMPGMDGQRTMQEIKEREYNVPVVIQTANAMNDERMVRLKSMTQGYLTKPIDPEELLAELVKYIR